MDDWRTNLRPNQKDLNSTKKPQPAMITQIIFYALPRCGLPFWLWTAARVAWRDNDRARELRWRARVTEGVRVTRSMTCRCPVQVPFSTHRTDSYGRYCVWLMRLVGFPNRHSCRATKTVPISSMDAKQWQRLKECPFEWCLLFNL